MLNHMTELTPSLDDVLQPSQAAASKESMENFEKMIFLFPDLEPCWHHWNAQDMRGKRMAMFEDMGRISKRSGHMRETISAERKSTYSAMFVHWMQFLVHEMGETDAVATEMLDGINRPANFNSGRFDLDSQNGPLMTWTPHTTPALFCPVEITDEVTIGSGGSSPCFFFDEAHDSKGQVFDDFPRAGSKNQALIGNARNDEFAVVAHLQKLMMKLHNKFVTLLCMERYNENDLFDEARRATLWHWRRFVFDEIVPLAIMPSIWHDIVKNGPKYVLDSSFSSEASIVMRIYHSMVPRTYFDIYGSEVSIFKDKPFTRVSNPPSYKMTFDQPANNLDMRLHHLLMSLPDGTNLTQRNSERQSTSHGVASYDDIADRMLADGAVPFVSVGNDWKNKLDIPALPLWQGCLIEADLMGVVKYDSALEHENGVLMNGMAGPIASRVIGEHIWQSAKECPLPDGYNPRHVLNLTMENFESIVLGDANATN